MHTEDDARQAWLNRLAREGEDDFLAWSEGVSLDTSALPSLRELPADDLPEELQGVDHPAGIRPELERMIEDAATDPKLAAELKRAGVPVPSATKKFHAGPWIVWMSRTKTGVFNCSARNEETGEEQDFEIDDARDTDDAMIRAGRLLRQDEKIGRELSPEDVLRIQRIAQSDKATALGEYLRLTLPAEVVERFIEDPDPYALLATPKLQPLLETALLNVWFWSTPAATLTDEFVEYVDAFAGGRALTFALIESAWLAYLDAREQEKTSGALNRLRESSQPSEPEPPTFRELDNLPDETISQLMSSTLRERADRIRGL